jgi:flagellar basal-body rod modification protein FlgD
MTPKVQGAPTQVSTTPFSDAGFSAGEGGALNRQKDSAEASTAPKFGEVYQQIQSKYGAKAEKPREIKKTLGKDDFLKIMITQMKNQDPTSPFKAEQMATQIAQFTSVEQLQNVNQNLNKMANQNKPLEQMTMTNMIGKVVTIDRERFPHHEGESESLSFNLPHDAETVTVALINENGEVTLEKEIGKQKAGEVSFPWDGNKSNTLPAKSGTYILRVEAKDEKGQSINTNPQAQAKIIGVSFEGADPVFLVGDSKHQEKITMRNIVRVEVEAPPAEKTPPRAAPVMPTLQKTPSQGLGQVPGHAQPAQVAASAPAAESAAIKPVTQPATKSPSFITFQKGVGSSTFSGGQPQSGSGVTPEAAQALEAFQEKGFPNGIKEAEGGE